MKVEKLQMHNFRRFNDTTIHFGKYLTCISGHNAVGKSTVLGILANSSELNKATGTTVHGQAFKVDLKEIMKFSEKNDESGSNKCTLKFNDLPEKSEESYDDKVSFRATWQSEDKSKKKGKQRKRYRLIPMKTPRRNTERKIQWPTFYLGLTRLYPVGEVADDNVSHENTIKLSEGEKTFLFKNHKSILENNDKYNDSMSLKIKNTKKTGFGIETDTYDALANSSGQDNLGQILLSLISFRRLKRKMNDNWIGGLLLIDEVDATLHPIAQNKLIDFLYDFAKEHQMQIIFTTHSLTLLEHINNKYDNIHPYYARKNMNQQLKFEINYLTSAHGELENYRNPEYIEIRNDLLNKFNGGYGEIKIYSEDNEARWFFDKVLEYYSQKQLIIYMPYNFNHISVNLGKNQLLNLLAGDFNYFSKHIILLDGDTEEKEINEILIGNTPIEYKENGKKYNILRLPGGDSPEKVLWNYAQSLPENHDFFVDTLGLSFSKRTFENAGPFSDEFSHLTVEREKFKAWFNKNHYILKTLINYWIQDNYNILMDFLKNLKDIHDFVGKRNLLNHEMIINIVKSHQETESTKIPTGQVN